MGIRTWSEFGQWGDVRSVAVTLEMISQKFCFSVHSKEDDHKIGLSVLCRSNNTSSTKSRTRIALSYHCLSQNCLPLFKTLSM